MRQYAVLLSEPSADATARLKDKYGRIYVLSDTSLLVRTSDLADDVAVAAGIKGDQRTVNGVVFKLNATYAGYHYRSLWDWLGDPE